MTRAPRKRPQSPYPRRPWVFALWIPAGVVAMVAGGALLAFGPWFIAPALPLVIGGPCALILVLTRLCTPAALRAVTLTLLCAPLLAVPLLSMNAVQDTVLAARGVSHQGTVAEVKVAHGKSTSYLCEVRYDAEPGRTHAVTCGDQDRSGERVEVSEDPSGWVDPKFTDLVGAGGFTRALALLAAGSALVISLAAALAGLLHHGWTSRSAGGQGGERPAGDLAADPQ